MSEMKPTHCLAGVLLLLCGAGCGVINSDPGPTQTAAESIDAGKAETVRVEIHMGGGELHIQGGASKLMDASFRYSEKLGRPDVRYDPAGVRGHLLVESHNKNSVGNAVNEWTLRMGSQTPLEMNVNVGGGTADLDMSSLPLRSADVNVGAGELHLNVAGKYAKNVDVTVNGGAGQSNIRLPKDMGAIVDATVGIGGVDANGLTQRDGKYYNAAYAEGKPAVRVHVRGGVGDIKLSVE
jgi:hypothetical protein